MRWVSATSLTVTTLRPDGPLNVMIRDVRTAGLLGDDGSVWLTSDIDPTGTVRRLDVAAYQGEQDLSATYLPVVTIRSPDGEAPIDVREVRPVRGGALRLRDRPRRIQLLTDTATGILVRPLAGGASPLCGPTVPAVGDLRVVAADASGIWFPTDDRRLAHVDRDGSVRAVDVPLPGQVAALAAPGDGSLLLVVRDTDGAALWRLPDAAAALSERAGDCRPS